MSGVGSISGSASWAWPVRGHAADAVSASPAATRQPDAFRAPPGAIPFADYLEARNLTERAAEPAQAPGELSPEPRRDQSLPRLADVAPVRKTPVQTRLEQRYQVEVPSPAGSLLDIVI